VVVHGQSDQIRLKSAKAQRDALDSFGGLPLTSLRTEYEQTFKQFEALRERHANLTASSDARSGRISLLRSWIAEIERVAPKAGELADVSSKIEKLSNLESLREGVSGAHEALSNTGYSDQVDAIGLLGLARKSLEGASGKDAQLGEFAERLRDIGSQLNDLAAEFSGYLTDLEGDGEESLEWLQERKSVLVGLARLHSVSPDELDGLLGRYSDELLEIDNSDEAIASSLAELAEASTKAERLAGELSAARHSAAQELETAVTAELAGLAMPNARVIVEVTALPELRGHGRDEVAFLLASFSGAQPRPISKGASGGELSRIMLALEVVLAKGVQAPTFIFDEVDAGVGGEAAIEVGRRLARLAQTAQVIVVTHLAQVAAFADRQLRVLKSHEGDVTSSDVVALEGEPRVAELARMISGMADSEAARKNAQELLSLARLSV
jgi:DNA repair protein RecN (Recombination protein N)